MPAPAVATAATYLAAGGSIATIGMSVVFGLGVGFCALGALADEVEQHRLNTERTSPTYQPTMDM